MAKKRQKTEGPSKASRFREVMGVLGDSAQPKDIVEQMQTKFGIEITPQMASTYKSAYLRKKSGGGSSGRSQRGVGAFSIEDATVIAGLVKRIGADGVSRLANALQ